MVPDVGWKEFEDFAATQQYVVRICEAAEYGLSPRTVWRVARRRDWQPDVPGIAWLPGAETPERWLMTGQLLVGEEGAITGWSALYAMGYLSSAPTKVHLVVPYGHGVTAHDRFNVRRSRTLAAEDRFSLGNFCLTTMERTLCQMSRRTELATLRGFALDARQRGDLTTAALRDCINRMGNFPGKARMAVLVEQIDEDESDSVFEFAMRRRLQAAGFRPDAEQFELQAPHRLLRIDIPWREYRVGLECDSLKHHGSRKSLHRDAQRHNSVQGTDWTVFRATWSHLDEDDAFAELCAILEAALSRAGHPGQ